MLLCVPDILDRLEVSTQTETKSLESTKPTGEKSQSAIFLLFVLTFNWASGKTEAVVEDSELLLLLATEEMSEQSLLSVLLFLKSKLLPVLKPGSPPLWTKLLVSQLLLPLL